MLGRCSRVFFAVGAIGIARLRRSIGGGPRRVANLALLLCLALAGNCTAPGTPPGIRIQPLADGDIQFAGCASVLVGPICLLKGQDDRLTLWVRTFPQLSVQLRMGGTPIVARPTWIDGGQRFEVQVPNNGATELTVTLNEERAIAWKLVLRPWKPDPTIAQAEALLASNKAKSAEALLRQTLNALSGARMARGLVLLAECSRRSGDFDRASQLLRQAVAIYREHRHASDVVDTSITLTHLHSARGRFAEARAILGPLAHETLGFAPTLIHYSLKKGTLAAHSDELGEALRYLAEAAMVAQRFAMHRLWRLPQMVRGTLLQRLGRRKEAAALFQTLWQTLPKDAPCRDRAMALNNWGWSRILRLEAGESVESPVPLFEQALHLFDQVCRDEYEQVNIRINLALASLHAGDGPKVRQWLREARQRAPHPEPPLALWIEDIRGRLALMEGRVEDSERHFLAMEKIAQAAGSKDGMFRATVGRGRALTHQGQLSQVLDAFAAAERLLDDLTVRVGLGDGRSHFLAQRKSAIQLYVRTLLELGLTRRAFAVVRRARRRALLTLARGARLAKLPSTQRSNWDSAIEAYRRGRTSMQRAASRDWRLPVDRLTRVLQKRAAEARRLERLLEQAYEALAGCAVAPDGLRTRSMSCSVETNPALRTPAPGELLLGYFEARSEWIGFAEDTAGLTVRRLGEVDPTGDRARLAASVLMPFAARVRRSSRILILPWGDLNEVDFHALPFDTGEPLLARKEVVYSLDLPPLPSERETAGQVPEILLVFDPNSDLPWARASAKNLRNRLSGRRAGAASVLQGDVARAEALLQRLPQVDWFAYSGHATFGGVGGWDSALRLAGDTSLTVGDVLALTQAPTDVALLACETGRGADAAVAGLGLAQAFVLAGTQRVFASTRPLSDALAADINRGLDPGSRLDSSFVRERLLAAREAKTTTDWASLRLIEP